MYFFIGFNIKILAKQKCLIKGNLAKILFINSLNNGILKGKIIIFFVLVAHIQIKNINCE